jgi:flagellar protein FlaG
VESINKYLQTVKRDLQFSVDASSGRTVITVLDRESQEIIRQIPPEAAVELAANLRSDGGLESLALAEKA